MTSNEYDSLRTEIRNELDLRFNNLEKLIDERIRSIETLMAADTIKRGCGAWFIRIEDEQRRLSDRISKVSEDAAVLAAKVAGMIAILTGIVNIVLAQ
jgi:hypothetical protein